MFVPVQDVPFNFDYNFLFIASLIIVQNDPKQNVSLSKKGQNILDYRLFIWDILTTDLLFGIFKLKKSTRDVMTGTLRRGTHYHKLNHHLRILSSGDYKYKGCQLWGTLCAFGTNDKSVPGLEMLAPGIIEVCWLRSLQIYLFCKDWTFYSKRHNKGGSLLL